MTFPSGWSMAKLGDLGEVNRGRSRHRPRYADHLYGGPYPFIQTGDIRASGGRITAHSQTYSAAGLAQSRLWPTGTMCITIAANIAETAILTYPACFPDSVVGFVADPAKANVDFIEYMFRKLRSSIQQQASGSVQDNINLATLDRLRFPLPSVLEQRAIANVLGALDDKIEQNQGTARALERLAQTIFRAWFVDFEPVKAKAAGATAFPSMPQSVFDALPTRFVESDLGPVPEGWDVTAVSGCTHLTMGQSPPSEHYNAVGVGLPFHQGVTDYGFRFPTHRIYCSVVGRIAEPLDVLLSVRAPVGRINVADRRLVLGRGLAGLRHLRGRQSFLLHQLAHAFAEEDAVGDGTIYKAVTKQFLSAMPMLSPADDAQAAFELIARPLDDLVLSSEMESRKLTAMRDYLLPKLLTGNVRIRAA